MSDLWSDLERELELWGEAGLGLWWRDDDAIDDDASLAPLLELAIGAGVPVALAVIPALAREGLARRLDGAPASISVLQHGYAHQNHAPATEKKCELGLHRPAMMTLGELGTGWLALQRLFGARALPVLVPPWNRIHPGLVPMLPEIGYAGLSTFGPRQRTFAVRGLRQVNVHVDLMQWGAAPRFRGAEATLSALVSVLQQLRALRARDVAAGEPVGIMTHHRVMDRATWDFVHELFNRLNRSRSARILAAGEVFGGDRPHPWS